ncbi:MAG: hypothetical protein J0I12_34550 [Candidatus Eremiobacteraeota bacterium]|nr:hypothetical protein [Candidatus Eremiobacteraeota bacterium]
MENGQVLSLKNYSVESHGPTCAIGDCLEVGDVAAEVVGFDQQRVFSRLLGNPYGIAPGTTVRATGKPLSVAVGPELKGQILDGLGRPLDGSLPGGEQRPLHLAAASFLQRRRVDRLLATGVRAIDGLLALGAGQSLALACEPGAGKTGVLSALARNSSAHSVVLASIGEQPHRLRDFLARDLGTDGLARSTVVAATAESSPGERVKAAFTALTVAEHFRDQGQDVLLLLDAVPDWWAAHREMGLPETGLEQLLARAGVCEKGTITTILVTDLEPQNDLLGLTEGVCTLSGQIARSGRYPAVDLSRSASRLFTEVASRQHLQCAKWLRSLLMHYQENELLIESGAYKPGFNQRVDEAIERFQDCQAFLRQDLFEAAEFQTTLEKLVQLRG